VIYKEFGRLFRNSEIGTKNVVEMMNECRGEIEGGGLLLEDKEDRPFHG
jgi:hypothetical protein